ncbi:CLUMA_CG016458, isoform A [Clunio marinus]|uniref:CLUMA_CG016458, isoform A n=1 Tax=Clunio marinus TaxID=568069 RepID=A0A1J1IVA5_9DIPT|nr:CLUMA_CG016458, isoform A [Clunio marinus]
MENLTLKALQLCNFLEYYQKQKQSVENMESLNKTAKLSKCPQEDASFLSFLTFSWIFPIFFKGSKQTLGVNDLYEPLNEQKADKLENDLQKAFKTRLELVPSIVDVFGMKILVHGMIILFVECAIKILPPIFLSQLIKFYTNSSGINQKEAAAYSFGIIFSIFLNSMISNASHVNGLKLGAMIKAGVSSMIYQKSLKLSKTSLGNITTGKLINLLATDAGKFQGIIFWIHYLWVGFIQTALVTFLIYQEVGVSAFAGIFVLISLLPLQLYAGTKISKICFETAKRTDKRVHLMNEMIKGIQVIKMYAWEKPFNKIISVSRFNETKLIRYHCWIRGFFLSCIIFSVPVAVFSTLVTYSILGNEVTAQKAFVVVAFFNVIKFTMVIMYPFAVNYAIDCRASSIRVNKFLKQENDLLEIKPNIKVHESIELKLNKVSAKWKGEATELTLSNINLDVQSSTILAVIGKVGAGKSSLIQAILGELPIEGGDIQVNGVISYASQEPWLFSGSVRQNILFGESYQKDRYKAVIKTCSLTRDLEMWPDGDKTIVGERGMSLSGGQKARINLARAVYRKADIYLLDDPLSAVDANVGRHLFDNCIKEFLKNKLVILVTHQLQYLPTADQILLLNHGIVEGVGTFENLRDSGLDFANLLPKNENVEEQKSENLAQKHSKGKFNEDNFVEKKENIEEKRVKGSVGLKPYKDYFNAAGGFKSIFIIFILYISSQIFTSTSDYFVSYLVRQEEMQSNVEIDENSYERNVVIAIFSGLIVGVILLTLSRNFVFSILTTRASRHLHDAMVAGITKASMYFFNTNPSGRILNRFSKDIKEVDEILPFTLVDVFQVIFNILGAVTVLVVINRFYLIPTFALFTIFHYLRKFYLKTSLDVKRIQSTTSSPIFSHFSETLNGLSTIRAFNAEKILASEFNRHQDLNTSAHYIYLVTSRAFGLWLDVSCVIYIAIVVLSFFLMENTGENVGLAITQAMGLTGMVQQGIRQTASLENSMTAVERVVEYNTVDPEPDFDSKPEKKPPKEWPEKGEIKFEKLSLSYVPDEMEEKVLKELNFEILPQEKIGIVGRTGAGKSSIINALFRLSYIDGQIYIDTRDTQAMGLHDLRSKISIIPQEPVLFSGSMRYNLDPFDEYSDAKLWSALEEVKLKEVISEMPAGLMTKISENGINFSIGERQLVCLARALLRENKILVMDEATANVDPQTDALIQETIRQKFAENCGVHLRK